MVTYSECSLNRNEIVKPKIVLEIKKNNREYVHGRSLKKENIRWIVIHYTACANVSAYSLCKSMVNNTEASSHFYVDENEIWEAVPLKYIAWHVGNGQCKQPDPEHKRTLEYLSQQNAKDWRYDLSAKFHLECIKNKEDYTSNSYCIGADLCVKKLSTKTRKATDKDWYFEEKAVDNMARLVAYLSILYNIDMDHIVRHCEMTGKLCPRPFVSIPSDDSGESRWLEFKKLVSVYRNYEIEMKKV